MAHIQQSMALTFLALALPFFPANRQARHEQRVLFMVGLYNETPVIEMKFMLLSLMYRIGCAHV